MKGFLEYLARHFKQGRHDLKNSKHVTSWLLILSMLATSVAGIEMTQLNLHTSILDLPTPKSFDGTVYPLAKTPYWHKLTSDEYTMSYDQIPADKMGPMPKYNPNNLQASLTSLGYSDTDNKLRDEKITYSVAYLGNYRLDGVEYAGSHPAVDIKAPAGTPVVAIANGVVTKVANQAYGFGLHVVVKHINVPTADGSTQTLYSSYSHMNRLDVKEGQLVDKGQQVGTVGDTGTATVEHLHFQVDNGGSADGLIESAPWHPYWPFTTTDYTSKGLTFFDAINEGIGQDKAIKYTINPMQFVQSYLTDADLKLADRSDLDESEYKDTQNPHEHPQDDEILEEDIDDSEGNDEIIDDTEDEISHEEPVVDEVETPKYTLEIKSKDAYLVGNNVEFEIIIKDLNGNTVANPLFDSSMILSSTDSSLLELDSDVLNADDFNNGAAKITGKAVKDGEIKLRVPFEDSIYESANVTIKSDVKDVHSFEVRHDGYFDVNRPEVIEIVPIDIDGNVTAYTIMGDVKVELTSGNARLSKTTLTQSDFLNNGGVAMLNVTPSDSNAIRIKASHSFIKGESESLVSGAPAFTDLSKSHENYSAIMELKDSGVISGYPDGTFKPQKGVSRVEALKLIFAGLKAVVPDPDSLEFRLADLYPSEWYAPYVAYAIDKGVVKGYPDGTFKPAQTVNKAEFAKMLVLGLNVDIDLNVDADAPIIGLDVRPSDWFYPYVSFLVENGIVDLVDNKFNPGHPMDRAKVAEAIWRVIESQ